MSGIKLTANFDLNAAIPLDSRISVINLSSILTPYEGMIVYQKSDKLYYKYADGTFTEFASGTNVENPSVDLTNTVHIGVDAPTDTKQLWIDNTDESTTELLKSDLQKNIENNLREFGVVVDDLKYALNFEMDPGYFKGILPGSNPLVPPIIPPPLDDGAKGTCGHIIVKRGLKSDLIKRLETDTVETLQEGEFGFCIDTEELYIGNKSAHRLIAKVGGSGGSGGGNVTAEYVELVSKAGNKFRLTINDIGSPIFCNSEADTIMPAQIVDNGRFVKLKINKVYGGGNSPINTIPVSHDFIEVYNSADISINLRGLSIQYGEYMQPWKMLALRGEIKPHSSFLIRCAQHSDPYLISTRFKIMDYDMDWNQIISNNGYSIYLCVGSEVTTYKNPANIDTLWTRAPGYIDLFGVGAEVTSYLLDAYVKEFLNIGNKYRMTKRKYSTDLTYTFSVKANKVGPAGNNKTDIEYVDMREASIEVYMPRSTKYGQWNYEYDKKPLDLLSPNVLTIGFGENGNTTRTFTWQSPVTDRGFLKYKIKGATEWNTVSTTKKFVSNEGTDVTVHSAIIKNLIPGTYIYKAGEEGRWGDEYELPVIDASLTTNTIKMLQVTDQQSWDETEMGAWGKASAYIQSMENYDFILNTGDISQNGIRSFEWRYYYDYSRSNMSTHVQMTCVGNNDLVTYNEVVPKADALAYTYYSTIENTPSSSGFPSVYSFNYGFIHYICLDSNVAIVGGFRQAAEQITWLQNDMNFTLHPENNKRWTIVYMHESPYTIWRNPKLMPFINVFAALKIDLVLCGHHHCNSRSNCMGATTSVTESKLVEGVMKDVTTVTDHIDIMGTYYVMCQATGFKTAGKQAEDQVAPYRARFDKLAFPCYILWEISYDKIKMFPYRLLNIIPLIDNVDKEVDRLPYDEGFEILNRALR